MRKTFTSSLFRTFLLTMVVGLITLSLSAQTTHQVAVTDNAYTPKQLAIKVGDKVVWTNTGAMGHNVNGTLAKYPSNPASFGRLEIGTNWTYEYVFTTAGTYSYQCDPHVGVGMTGTVTVSPAVVAPFNLTVNFSAMTPHVGQVLWLAVIEQGTNVEIARVRQTATASFSIVIPGIEAGKSYNVDFYADHNKNGVYNAPPTDHAWRLPLNNVTGDAVLNFVHNTTFTSIAWKNKLTVHFTAMTPHLTQTLTLYVKDAASTLDTKVIPSIAGAVFDISSWVIEPTKSYVIDFYADHNKNGAYNAPPTDHAWRLLLTNVKSDTIINFVHNTTFFNISLATANEVAVDSPLSSLRLYPNPASQSINLLFPGASKNIRSLKVFSLAGTLIDQKAISPGVESIQYDVSKFKSGVYFMEINSATQKNTLKFLKQ